MTAVKRVVILLAAGKGNRLAKSDTSASEAGAAAVPKQYRLLDDVPIIRRAAACFVDSPHITSIQPVIGAGQEHFCAQALEGLNKIRPPVIGGAMRQDSVRAGLDVLPPDTDHVLIHDGARPFVSHNLLGRVIESLAVHRAVIPTLPLSETIKSIDQQGYVRETVSRDGLHRVQTPQGFRYSDIVTAHQKAHAQGITTFTDDASIAEWADVPVFRIDGEGGNIKITTRDDLDSAMRHIKSQQASSTSEIAVGFGWDVHGFDKGDHVMLCGIRIPHSHRLAGHSDADVGLHAITDALFGAMAQGDIGVHFPPTDAQWKNAASDIFLRHGVDMAHRQGCRILHCDTTFVCELPKISPHAAAMRARVATILGIHIDRVSVKATTSERLGFTGRKEGIIAMSTVTLEKQRREL